MSAASASGDLRRYTAHIGLLVVAVAAFVLFLANNDFPYWYHADEPGKAERFIDGVRSFKHPQLMIEVLRLGNWLRPAEGMQAVVEAGRLNSALFGVALVLVTFLLARRVLSDGWALFVAALTGFSPLVVVHAHYLKEDIYLAVFFVATLLSLIRYLETRRRRDALLLGAMLGLAVSSKYPGLLLLVPVLAAPVLDPSLKYRAYLRDLSTVGLIAAVVVLTVNYGLFQAWDALIDGIRFESRHVVRGHDIRVWFWDTAFGFHLKHSLVTGMSLPVVLLALAGFFMNLFMWRRIGVAQRVLVIGAAVFYLAHEVTPTKPYPDFMRYMVPLAPLAALFTAQALRAVMERLPAAGWRRIALVLPLLAVAVPLGDSLRLVNHLNRDTRSEIPEFNEPVVYGRYTLNPKPDGIRRANVLNIGFRKAKKVLANDPEIAVISSFAYDRYLYGENLSFQKWRVARRAKRFRALMACEHRVIRPAHRSYAFSNPTIRIIDLDRCPAAPIVD